MVRLVGGGVILCRHAHRKLEAGGVSVPEIYDTHTTIIEFTDLLYFCDVSSCTDYVRPSLTLTLTLTPT